eukprot:7454993-Pyramimonas_sp.AAC.1
MITGPPPPPGPELENNVVFQTRGKPDSGASRSEPQAHSSGVEGIQVVVIGENSEEAGAGSAEGSLAGVSGPGARVYTNPVSVLALEGGDAELASAAVPGLRVQVRRRQGFDALAGKRDARPSDERREGRRGRGETDANQRVRFRPLGRVARHGGSLANPLPARDAVV